MDKEKLAQAITSLLPNPDVDFIRRTLDTGEISPDYAWLAFKCLKALDDNSYRFECYKATGAFFYRFYSDPLGEAIFNAVIDWFETRAVD